MGFEVSFVYSVGVVDDGTASWFTPWVLGVGIEVSVSCAVEVPAGILVGFEVSFVYPVEVPDDGAASWFTPKVLGVGIEVSFSCAVEVPVVLIEVLGDAEPYPKLEVVGVEISFICSVEVLCDCGPPYPLLEGLEVGIEASFSCAVEQPVLSVEVQEDGTRLCAPVEVLGVGIELSNCLVPILGGAELYP